jgi:hypothetical protein
MLRFGIKKNIRGFAFTVISAKSHNAYKKLSTINIILICSPSFGTVPCLIYIYCKDMLKVQRFDLPPGIENNCVDWQKVMSAADYELTQARAKFKKEVSLSFMLHDGRELHLHC